MDRFAAVALTALSLAAQPAVGATNLLTNGSFESGDTSGWRTSGRPNKPKISCDGTYGEASDGRCLAALYGAGGILAQDLTLNPGDLHELTFDYATQDSEQVIRAFLIFTPRDPLEPPTEVGFVLEDFIRGPFRPYTYRFVAEARSTRLMFIVGDRGTTGLTLLDNVRLTNISPVQPGGGPSLPTSPVPEPGTWATMILGFGAVGLAARRRRNGTCRVAA